MAKSDADERLIAELDRVPGMRHTFCLAKVGSSGRAAADATISGYGRAAWRQPRAAG
jgi:hypothetical protein